MVAILIKVLIGLRGIGFSVWRDNCYSEGLAYFFCKQPIGCFMHRKAKLNIDYKVLHTSGIKVIKNNMTDKLIQEELDLVLDIEEHIEDHNPHELETPLEADNAIAEYKKYLERFKKCQTELKVALGEDYGDKYPGRGDTRKTFPRYLSVFGGAASRK